MTQADLIYTVSTNLSNNGYIFLQSDVQSITNEMEKEFMKNSVLYKHYEKNCLTINYFTILTEREAATLNKNKLVYRTLLQPAYRYS